MKFPITLPMKDPYITFSVWNQELASSNDYISEASFKFDVEAAKAFRTDKAVKVTN